MDAGVMANIATAAVAAGAAGLGVGAGLKVARLGLDSTRWSSGWENRPEAAYEREIERMTIEREAIANPRGRRRTSSIAGLYRDTLRHTDGSISRGYHVELEPSMFTYDAEIDARYDALGRMLADDKPPGTVIQFRLANAPDPGSSIEEHLALLATLSTHPKAVRLHALNIAFKQQAARSGAFRRSILSMWVRIPVSLKTDAARNGSTAFFAETAELLRRTPKRRIFGGALPGQVAEIYERHVGERMVRRLEREQQEAYLQAEREFRRIESNCPLRLRRFTRQELWEAIYLGHRLNGSRDRIPNPDDVPGRDVRDYLCQETILGGHWYVLQGQCPTHPAAMVSLMVPPNENIFGNAMRALIARPDLNFKHTLCTEYVYPEQRREVKKLDKRIGQVERSRVRFDGTMKDSPEAAEAMKALIPVRQAVTGTGEALIEARLYAIVYGQPARSKKELEASVEQLETSCEELIAAFNKIPGAEAAREEPDVVRALYQSSLTGEIDPKKTYREIKEVASSLSCLVPTEAAWVGSPRPHTIVSTTTGRLLGINFFDRMRVQSPMILVLGRPGSGKSTFMALTIKDILACVPHVKVRAIDFGESFGPLVDVLGGRHLKFRIGEEHKTLNVWYYPGLEQGEPPSLIQKAMVVGDLKKLARVPYSDKVADDVLSEMVDRVYENFVPLNGEGKALLEPRHSNLLDLLPYHPFIGEEAKSRAGTLLLALNKYRDNPWLDSPTHPDFLDDTSPLDVFELDTLTQFPEDVKAALGFRAAARMRSSIGALQADGTRTPTVLIFDENWKIKEEFPDIFQVVRLSGRQGRKENVVTILASHAYQDLEAVHDITKTAEVAVIGKPKGDITPLVDDLRLSDEARHGIRSIRNHIGMHHEFVTVFGSDNDQVVEMIKVELSPVELWMFTTNPDERNARARVSVIAQDCGWDWDQADVIEWLATNYPRGLTAVGLTEINEGLLLGEEE